MKLQESMRKEILRLVRTRHNSACINTRRLSAFYNLPEKEVRRELTRLADERVIRLSGWDGQALRPYREWSSAEEFVAKAGDGHVRVEMEMAKTASATAG